jgi:hypothetical protein
MARSLGRRWSLSLSADAARLRSERDDGVGEEESVRLEAGASLGRSLSDELVLGVNGRAVRYSEASPLVDDLRLFWDPRAVLSLGIFGQWNHDLSERWTLSARANPNFALIHERTSSGFQAIPHFLAEAGLSHQNNRFRTSVDAFFYQGRFDGYRAYGLRISLSAVNRFRNGGGR